MENGDNRKPKREFLWVYGPQPPNGLTDKRGSIRWVFFSELKGGILRKYELVFFPNDRRFRTFAHDLSDKEAAYAKSQSDLFGKRYLPRDAKPEFVTDMLRKMLSEQAIANTVAASLRGGK